MLRVCGALLLLASLRVAEAFSPLAAPGLRAERLRPYTLSSRPSLSRLVSQLDKVEEKAVQRFTKQYDKLCKTCPTRLQTRVDTVTEMIINLPEEERMEIFAQVESRLKNGDDRAEVLKVNPGTQGEVVPTGKMDCETVEVLDEKMQKKMKGTMEENKVAKKMRKLEEKIDKNVMKLMEADAKLQLLHDIHGGNNTMPTDENLIKDYTKMRDLSPERLEVKRLKLVEKKAKYERKIAECKLDLKDMKGSIDAAAPVC